MAHVLIIDDEETVRRCLRMMLERDGYVVAEAPDGKAGVASCRERCPDVVLCDFLMREMNGLQTLQALRAELPRLPVILISGSLHGSPELQESARQFGACCVLPKPILREELLQAVQAALDAADAGTGQA